MKKLYCSAVISIALAASAGVFARAEEAAYQPVEQVYGYTLSDTKQGEDSFSVRYTKPSGQAFTVVYTTAEYTPGGQDRLQFLFEPLLYSCYGKNDDEKQLSTVHYTAGDYSVTISTDEPQPRSEMLPLAEQVQALPSPFCSRACPDCGAAAMQDMSFALGEWEQTGTRNCGHGGAGRYSDVQQTRTVTHTWACPACKQLQTNTTQQKAEYCCYGKRTYAK